MIEAHRELIKDRFDSSTLFFDEPMFMHTSFKIGGPADLLFVPQSIQVMEDMIKFCQRMGISFYIMGNGSNLLVSDLGYRGVIIQVYKNLSDVRIVGNQVFAEAGVLLSSLSKQILSVGLAGFEFASGIPGTLGGAIYMNAGAYGGEIKDVIVSARVLSRDGCFRNMDKIELELGYRHSSLQAKGDMVISAILQLESGEPQQIKALMAELNEKRRDKQPIDKPSAGSTFKRPEGYYAGKLIMDAGLRGKQIGGAKVSEKHCGFIINEGDATCNDVLELIAYVQAEVKVQFGVDLEPEVRILGEVN